MLSTLASHNEDIQKLIVKGYAVSIDSNCLVVRDIPFLDENKDLRVGAMVSKLVFIDKTRVQMDDHQIYFCGSHPHQMNGMPIPNLGGGQMSLPLESSDLVVERSFSNKPINGFGNLFEKIESYVTIISGPAMNLHNITPFTFRTTEEIAGSVFKIQDTLSSRAEIGDLVLQFKEDIIAIVGLGGTGSYVLDFLVKTPVKEIRGFDLDMFHVHNAFRAPGHLDLEELGKTKAEVYQRRYDSLREGVIISNKAILSDSEEDLKNVTFAFVCVDKGSSRKEIFDLLIRMDIPFIDVGIGLDKRNGPISGTVRATFFEPEFAREIIEKRVAPLTDPPDNIYHNNIQISELNALNACLAVIRYKQLRGFYADDSQFFQMLFTLDNLKLNGE